MRFLGLGLEGRAPDAKTIWLFRGLLVRARTIDTLFDRFDRELAVNSYLAMSGQIVDASVVSARKQRNDDAEKAGIKGGAHPRGL